MAIEDYATFQNIADAMPDITIDDVNYQAIITTLAGRASRLVDAYKGRKPGAFYVTSDVTQYFNGSGDVELWIGELAAAPTSVSVAETGVLTSYTAWAATDYYPWPWNALDEGVPYIRLDVDIWNGTKSYWYAYPKSVKVVGRFGFATAIPSEIAEATIIQTMRWFKRGQQAWQDTAAIIELGQLRYTQALDPDIKTLLDAPKFNRMTV